MRRLGRLIAQPLGLSVVILALLAAAGGLLAGSAPDSAGWWLGIGLGATGLVALPPVLVGWRHTERSRALQAREQELDAQREALLQLVSHEIRTPLTVIRAASTRCCAGRARSPRPPPRCWRPPSARPPASSR